MYLFILIDTGEAIQMSELGDGDVDSVKNGVADIFSVNSMGKFIMIDRESVKWKEVKVYE